jgi:Predicted integral membrane protein
MDGSADSAGTEGRERPMPAPSLKDACYVNAMIHFYRGELSRIMVWRQRLDVTTTWAITSSTTVITVAYSFRDIPHIIFFFDLALVWIMLWIEARRYRFYDAFRGRVRMLESHFLVPMISQSDRLLDGEWRRLVCEDLILPSFKITKLEAIGRRLQRNYAFIFAVIMLAWLGKIFIHADPPIDDLGSFYRAFAAGHLPAWLNASIFFGTIGVVTAIIVYVTGRTSDEISEFGAEHTSLWRI